MKKGKTIFKRFLSGFLSCLIILFMLPFTPLTVIATSNENSSQLGNTKVSTVPNNSNSFMTAQSVVDLTTGYADLFGRSIGAIRGAIDSFDSNDTWYENIWNIGSGAVAGFLGLSSPNTSAPIVQYDFDEMKSMIKSMDNDIQAINSKLENLEATVQANFEQLASIIVNKIQETEYKQFLNEFTQVNDSNAFSYYAFFKPNLSQRYNELLIALEAGNENNVKQAYDNLYLAAKQSEQLYYYVSGESTILTGKQSIQDILYDYSVLSSEEDFESTCLQFTEDANNTFIFAQYCLSLCYNYQLLYAHMNEQSYDAYYYVQQKDTSVESIQYSSVSSKITDMLHRQECVTKNLAKYVCKVLRLSREFDYTSHGIRFGTIPYRTNNNIQRGDVIQICEMPDKYMEMFNPRGFNISVSNSNAQLLSGGIVKVVGTSGLFDVIYSYDGVECYRISFNIVAKYSGGIGIKEAPYLISTLSDFNSIRVAEEQCYYLLINDINYNGSRLAVISISTGGFGGVLDGGGYKVYNYQITDYLMNNYQFNNSLFPIVKQGAIIKNLTIGDSDCHTYNGYSVQHTYSVSPGGYSLTAYNGILSGINEGTISNCNIQNVMINARIEMPSNASYFWSLDAYVGGFAADNRGTIARSVISNSNLKNLYKSNQAPCKLFIGGISGMNRGRVVNCFSLNNSIIAETTAASYTWSTQSLIYGGNIIGQNNGSTSMVFGMNCNITMNPYGTHVRRAIYGINPSSMPSSGDISTMQRYGWVDSGNGTAILDHNLSKFMCDFAPPHKTVYYVGDALNLSGLKLFYGNTITVDSLGINNREKAYGFEVTGFDSSSAGTQIVTLTYNDLSILFKVTVLCPHQWENGCETTKPSHTEYGVYTETCSICGETKESAIDKLSEHEFSSWSCYNSEEHQKACNCGYTVKESHKWNAGVTTTPATHTTVGVMTYTCETCKATKTEEIPKLAKHTYGVWAKLNDGQHQKVCICGDTVVEDHSWDEGVTTIPATYTADGIMTYTCNDCKATYTEIIPKLSISADTIAITVDDASATIGKSLSIDIKLANNPGVTSVRVAVHYDSNLLKLTNVSYNSAMGGQAVAPEDYNVLNDTVVLYWIDGFNNYTDDGNFVTLTFDIGEHATVGTQTEISVTYESDDIYDVNDDNVTFAIKAGNITFVNYLPGDINGDGVVNTKDTTRLMRYFAGWNVEVVEDTLDVNGDGAINTKDTTHLMRYLAGWDINIY